MDYLTNFIDKDYKNNRNPVIAELISTEEEYVKKLEKVVCGYVTEYYNESSEIPLPEDLKEHNGCLIFANICDIYQWHKHYFLGALKENQHSVRALSKIFTQNEQNFHMYAKFGFNKSISQYLISTNLNYFDQVKKKLKHKYSIDNLMIAPIQRVTRYEMLLKEIRKYLRKSDLSGDIEYVDEAWNMIKEVCNAVNEFITLNGIRNFDGLISAQGKLLFHGYLMCSFDGKRTNLYVFLFKFLIIFTEKQAPKKKNLDPTYNFRLQISMNKLHLKEINSCKFSLQLMDPNVPNCRVVCQAASKMEHKKWIIAIKQQLEQQTNLIHDLQHPSTDHEGREVLL